MKRREVIKNLALGSLVLPRLLNFTSSETLEKSNKSLKGTINHSVCRWTFDQLTIEELCLLVKKIGFSAIDLVEPKDFPILKKYGIYSSMCTGALISLTEGWNDLKNHPILIDNYSRHID